MIRFLFRTLAFIAFAVAVMFVVIDATRSIGVSAIAYTTLAESLEVAAPTALQALRDWLTTAAPAFVTDPLLATVLAAPTSVVFAVFAVLFFVIGHKPAPKGLKRRAR